MTTGVRHALAALPRGGELDTAAWRRRHILLVATLVAHLPILVAVGLLGGRPAGRIAADAVPVVVIAGVAALLMGRTKGRTAPSTVVVLGLVWCSAALIDLSGGSAEARLHFFVLLALVAMYEDWRPFALAVALVVGGHVLGAAFAPEVLYASRRAASNPWPWTALHISFVLLSAGAFVAYWGLHEREQRRAREYWEQLYEGERAVVAQLRQAEQLKDELVAIVSHEFRTPLTAILGFASTLRARIDDLDRVQALTCARAIERQTKRLSAIVSNLLAANGDIEVDPGAVTDVHAVATEVVAQVAEYAPAAPRLIHVDVPTSLWAGMSAPSLRLVLVNLVDNALKFAVPHTAIKVRARARDDTIVLEVENRGGPIVDADRERIFEAFVQGDSSDSRRYGGLGLGLHVVEKVTAAYGGTVTVRNVDDRVVFTAVLPAALRSAASPARADETTPVLPMSEPRAESPSRAEGVQVRGLRRGQGRARSA